MAEVCLIDKILSEADVLHRLAFPAASLDAFHFPEGQLSVEFQAIDKNQKTWMLKLAIRNPDPPPRPVLSLKPRNTQRKYHPKPEITGDWLRFVGEKRLQKGDKIILISRVDDANCKVYYIKAQKKHMCGAFYDV